MTQRFGLALLLGICGCTADNPGTGGDDMTETMNGGDASGGDLANTVPPDAFVADLVAACPMTQKMCNNQCVDADPAHGCGAVACTACGGGANGQPACVAGACGLQCNVGFGDCDGNASNGCEKDVTSDPANCGSCGFACQNGAPCVNGACQLVMPGPGSDQACLTIDANNIYWATANANPGAVYSVPKGGGQPTQIITGQASPRGIAVDGTSVYFTLLTGGRVLKCPLAGCNNNPTLIASNQQNPFGLTVDGTNVYWTNRGNGTVMKCAIAGCNNQPTMVAGNQAMPTEIAVDGNNVYWANAGDGTVWKAPVGGGNPTMVTATNMPGAHGIASDGNFVYFTQGMQGLVERVPVGGGNATAIAMGQAHPWGLALDGMGTVVWSNSQAANMGGAVLKAPAAGGPAVTRAAMQQFPLCVAADATTIYWIDAGGNSVQKVAK